MNDQTLDNSIKENVNNLKKLVISFSVKKLRLLIQKSAEFRLLYKRFYQSVAIKNE